MSPKIYSVLVTSLGKHVNGSGRFHFGFVGRCVNLQNGPFLPNTNRQKDWERTSSGYHYLKTDLPKGLARRSDARTGDMWSTSRAYRSASAYLQLAAPALGPRIPVRVRVREIPASYASCTSSRTRSHLTLAEQSRTRESTVAHTSEYIGAQERVQSRTRASTCTKYSDTHEQLQIQKYRYSRAHEKVLVQKHMYSSTHE
jgi:hypothetical protein